MFASQGKLLMYDVGGLALRFVIITVLACYFAATYVENCLTALLGM